MKAIEKLKKPSLILTAWLMSLSAAFGQQFKDIEDASEDLKGTTITVVGNIILAALALGSLWVVYSLVSGDGKASRNVVVGFVLGWAFYLIVFEVLLK